MNTDRLIGRLAGRYGVSEEAVETLSRALDRGGHRIAQFSHPELGGFGQWMPGMTQIGDMFNHDLRSRVERLCQELSDHFQNRTPPPSATDSDQNLTPPRVTAMKPMEPMKPMSGMKPMEPMKPMKALERWWPDELGDSPNSAGGQNEARYAFFSDKRRLAVDTGDGRVQIYDTGDHQISGVQQHQSSGGKKTTFTSQHGEVDLAKLRPV